MAGFSFDRQGLFFSLKITLLVVGVLVVVNIGERALTAYATTDDNNVVADERDQSVVDALLARLNYHDTSVGTFGTESRTHTESIEDYVPTVGRFVGVDLTAMELTLYENKVPVTVLPLLAKSDVASADGMTTGIYMVESKEERDFSTIGKFYLPWRVQFDDRFSLHGIPKTGDGAVAENGASAGVMLADTDAQTLYSFVEAGTGIFILERDTMSATRLLAGVAFSEESLPAVSARAYIVSDVVTGETYVSKNAEKRYPIASISKLITAMVAQDTIGFHESVAMPDNTHFTVGDLYHPLFLKSDNEVARALAEHVGYPEFIARMNTTARSIGMYHTSFADSSGLTPKNVSTPKDLSQLAAYLYENKRFLLDISSEDDMTITAEDGTRWRMTNQNKLSDDPHFIGGKLGFTDEARQTSLALFTIPVDGSTRVLSVVILGSDDWKQDTRTLLTWFSENAHAREPLAQSR